MIPRALVCLVLLLLAACSRSTSIGTYETIGSENQFKMTLELAEGGNARFVTKANLGKTENDRSIEAAMSVQAARWTAEKNEIVLTGTRVIDKKPVTHRFAFDANGDLLWKENGARFRKKAK